MLRDYEVTAPNHIHAGQPLCVGDTIALDPRIAELHPDTFKPKRAISTKAERSARSTSTAKPSTED